MVAELFGASVIFTHEYWPILNEVLSSDAGFQKTPSILLYPNDVNNKIFGDNEEDTVHVVDDISSKYKRFETEVLTFIPEPSIDPRILKNSVIHSLEHNECSPRKIESSSACTCSNCGTNETTLWRRAQGKLMCNPCALYLKLHGVQRPLHLLNSCIRRRNRNSSKRKRC